MFRFVSVSEAVYVLQQGELILYPTEAVYGLGCDPFQEEGVNKLIWLKKRAATKSFILVAAEWDQVSELVLKIPERRLKAIFATWPGPYTWVFPANLGTVPPWLLGEHDTLALRISAHPCVRSLCEAFSGPIISTSANFSGLAPVVKKEKLSLQFGEVISVCVEGEIGTLARPTEIRLALDGTQLR